MSSHERPEFERVIEEYARWSIVKKIGTAGEVAQNRIPAKRDRPVGRTVRREELAVSPMPVRSPLADELESYAVRCERSLEEARASGDRSASRFFSVVLHAAAALRIAADQQRRGDEQQREQSLMIAATLAGDAAAALREETDDEHLALCGSVGARASALRQRP